ncbi:MAG: hypothetical protein M3N53_04485 [Actinomycetota bacterium]|nr:hypothetical protein [Actinomycetota bacterium]
MRKLAAVLTFVLLVGGVLLGSLQPASSQASGGRTLTFFDPNRTDFEKNIDEGREGFSPGDWGVIKDRFFDPDTCEKAGTFLGRFTFVKAAGQNDGFFLLDGGALLSDGKLTFYWPGRFTEFASPDAAGAGGAVTGGTGPYAGAGGTVTVREDQQMCDKNGALVTIELTQ